MLLQRKKVRWLLVLGILLVALILLSAGLSNLELQPGEPLSLLSQSETTFGSGMNGSGEGTVFEILWRVFFFVFILLLPFSILQFIISPDARKRVLRDLSIMLAFLLMYWAFIQALRESIFDPQQTTEQPPAPTLPAEPAPTGFVANPSDWLVTAVSIAFVALIIGLLIGVAWYVRRSTESPLEQLAGEAQDTLEELRAGRDFRNTVIRSYAEMSRILSERQGITRRQGMTPREFEQRLKDVGLPREDVGRLTHLFEEVRYGARSPGEGDEREAEACLTAIVHAAGRTP